jgi:hypothetical protein
MLMRPIGGWRDWSQCRRRRRQKKKKRSCLQRKQQQQFGIPLHIQAMEVDERKKREDGKRKSTTKFPLTIMFPPSFVEECCNFIPTWSNPKMGFLPPPHKRVHASDRGGQLDGRAMLLLCLFEFGGSDPGTVIPLFFQQYRTETPTGSSILWSLLLVTTIYIRTEHVDDVHISLSLQKHEEEEEEIKTTTPRVNLQRKKTGKMAA